MANFDVLIGKLHAADEAIEALSKADFDELVGDIKEKVDSIQDFLTRCDSESKRLDGLIKDFQAKKKTVDNTAKSFKEWVAYSMAKHEMPYLEGKIFSVKLQEREATVINENITLDSSAFMKYKGLIRRKYEWDKTAVKDALKAGEFQNVGEIVKNKFVKFSARKGIK